MSQLEGGVALCAQQLLWALTCLLALAPGPWSAGTSRNPSTAWCVLYRMLCMRLTRNQMHAMLNHRVRSFLRRTLCGARACAELVLTYTPAPTLAHVQDSVYIRAVGFLYLRLATDAKELWDWYSPHLEDETEIAPGPDGAVMPLWKFLRMLLTEMSYYGTMLPRIPVLTARELKVKLAMLDQAAQRAEENATKLHLFKKGTKVRAIFSEDHQWYDATLGDEVAEGEFEVVYDNYGNSEVRRLGFIELKDGPTAGRGRGGGGDGGRGGGSSRGGGRGRHSYEDIAKQVLERERSGALASGKDYAQRPASYKGSLSLKMDRYTSRRASRSRSPVRRRSSRDRSPPRRRSRDRRDSRDDRYRRDDRRDRDRDYDRRRGRSGDRDRDRDSRDHRRRSHDRDGRRHRSGSRDAGRR